MDRLGLVAIIAALASLVAIAAIMASCSKHVADVEANPQKACLEAGGSWVHLDPRPGVVGQCLGRSK